MLYHASCAARDGAGVLLIGASGSGKSDLVLRLLDHGFSLVADDQVDVEGGFAAAPASLAGMLEVRGLGIVRLPFVAQTTLALVVELGAGERMPARRSWRGLPLVAIDGREASAPQKVAVALRCATRELAVVAGAFA